MRERREHAPQSFPTCLACLHLLQQGRSRNVLPFDARKVLTKLFGGACPVIRKHRLVRRRLLVLNEKPIYLIVCPEGFPRAAALQGVRQG